MLDTLTIDSYSVAGNVIVPTINITLQQDTCFGIHTDFAKIDHLLNQFQIQLNTYIHYREDGLYERLTVKEYFSFIKGIYNSTESVEYFSQLLSFEKQLKTKICKLSNSEKQRLRFIHCILNDHMINVFEEPFQNIDEHTKKVLLNIFQLLKNKEKRLIILSSNMEDLLLSCDLINRLSNNGLHLIDIQEEEQIKQPINDTTHIRFEKIPTRLNDKIILFNPPEIDYIESIEGEVSLFVSGESYPCSLTLNDLEVKLTPFGFFRCHRSYIVNLQKVREIITWTRNSYSLSLNTKEESIVPLSKNKLVELKRTIGI